MVRLTREESQARTRSLLIEAARALISEKGFATATVRDIAEAAGFSQGAFYSNFPDKDSVLLELAERHQIEERARIEGALATAGGAADAMAAVEKWALTLNADRSFAALAIELQLQALRSPEFAKAYRALDRKHRALLGELIARLFVALGKRPPDDPAAIATGFAVLVRGMALQSGDTGASESGRVVIAFLKALIASAPDETPNRQRG